MPKNIVICCDGTGNEINADLSNVLKLFRVVLKNDAQIVFYDPGVGTLPEPGHWTPLGRKLSVLALVLRLLAPVPVLMAV